MEYAPKKGGGPRGYWNGSSGNENDEKKTYYTNLGLNAGSPDKSDKDGNECQGASEKVAKHRKTSVRINYFNL